MDGMIGAVVWSSDCTVCTSCMATAVEPFILATLDLRTNRVFTVGGWLLCK